MKLFWTLHVVAQAPEVPQLGPEPDGEVGAHDCLVLCPQLLIRSYFGPSMRLHRLQRFPNLALYPMEKLETMIF